MLSRNARRRPSAAGTQGASGAYSLERIWGKSRGLPDGVTYPLVCHLVDSAATATALWDGYVSAATRGWLADQVGGGDPDLARAWLATAAGLHDLGKATPAFTTQDRAAAARIDPALATWEGPTVRHDESGYWSLLDLLSARGWSWTEDVDPVATPAHRLAEVVGGHHGTYPPLVSPRDVPARMCHPAVGGPAWAATRAAVLDAVLAVTGPAAASGAVPGGGLVPLEALSAEAAVVLTGLVALADWLASEERSIRAHLAAGIDVTPGGLAAHFTRARDLAAAATRQAGLTRFAPTPRPFPARFGFPPRGIQEALDTGLPPAVTGPGLLLVMAPTGEGKTEAAWAAATHLAEKTGSSGVFVALPTMATTDAMHTRVEAFVTADITGPGDPADGTDGPGEVIATPVTRLHGLASLPPLVSDPAESAGLCPSATDATAWLQGNRRKILAPVAVGTIDQVISAALRSRHGPLRWAALANKVLVIDEVHAYDPYMQILLRRTLTWLARLGVPVVALSATLPQSLAEDLTAAYHRGVPGADPDAAPEVTSTYPGWAFYDASTRQVTQQSSPPVRERRLRVTLAPTRPGDADPVLLEHLAPLRDEDGGCVLVVCNTVAAAQGRYETLRETLAGTGTEVMLLHSRFPLGQRQEITDAVEAKFGKDAARPHRAVLVATQVIEQSLDIDFDLVVSDLAPISLLLQRAGRGHRHPRPRPAACTDPTLVVLAPTGDATLDGDLEWGRARGDLYVYPETVLRSTWAALRATDGPVAVPGDVQGLVDAVTGPDFLDATNEETRLKDWLKSATGQAAADRVAVPHPADLAELHPMTSPHDPEDIVATRFGANTMRVLPYWHRDGADYLDRDATIPLPTGTLTQKDAMTLIRHTITVRPSRWTKDISGDPSSTRPPAWRRWPVLSEARPMLMHAIPGEADAVTHTDQVVTLHRDLGLRTGATGGTRT